MGDRLAGVVAVFALDRAFGPVAGAPERVYWLTKLLALKHLAEVGGPAQREVVTKFLADPSGYEYEEVKVERDTGKVISRHPTHIAFASLARTAIDRIGAR